MAKDLLFEIGMEEIPARFIRAAAEQLEQKTRKWLEDNRVGFAGLKAYATPRRIAVLAQAVEEKQADLNEEVKGPSKKIALDGNGEWSKAAQGFARSQGVDAADLVFRELAGVEYVYARKSSAGNATASLLSEGLAGIAQSMSFPKNMRWGAHELKFVRPIRWLVALFGEDVVPLALAGVQAGRTTRGHRFLGRDVELARPSDYVPALKEQFVYADMDERQALILKQLNEKARANNWNVPIQDDLLEEVVFLVEYPTVLSGGFHPDFLEIPQEVLITSMREHQRYFPVLNAEGKLLPHFITVRNGDDRSLDTIAKGNEKVLRARLSDARFFYMEDQKLPIDRCIAKLDTIVFHEELGTIGDKVRRIGAIAERIAQAAGTDRTVAGKISRAAAICKFDLVTQMVYEFPELQGVMGEDYALKKGEDPEVARAVFEHYQPRSSGDSAPASLVGAVVGMADKLDTIAGCFSIGIIPTGSQDPYALRRQAAGIVQTLLAHDLPLTLGALFAIAVDTLEAARPLKRVRADIVADLYDFFGLRVKNVLSDNVRYDLIDAVMAAGIDDVASVVRKGQVLMNRVADPEMKPAAESFTRVVNLAAKAESADIDAAAFAEPVEHELYDAWRSLHEEYASLLSAGKEDEALTRLTGLRDAITRYFDTVMVMADDERVRRSRLALLAAIAGDVHRFADFRKIVW